MRAGAEMIDDGKAGAKAEAASTESFGSDAKLMAMRALAMGEAFALRHGREALADPEAYQRAGDDLTAVLAERVEAFEVRLGQLAGQPKVSRTAFEMSEAIASFTGSSVPSTGMGPGGGKASYALERQRAVEASQDAERRKLQDSLKSREQDALVRMCRAAGVWEMAVDPSRAAALSTAFGLHESRIELSLSPSKLENLREAYVVHARVETGGQVSFACEAKPGLGGRALIAEALAKRERGSGPSMPHLEWPSKVNAQDPFKELSDGASALWGAFSLGGARMPKGLFDAEARAAGDSRHRAMSLFTFNNSINAFSGEDLTALSSGHLGSVEDGAAMAKASLERARQGLFPEQVVLDLI